MRASQPGQATVEFALVSTVLVLLLAGAIGFGNLYAAKLDLAGGARAGARWAAANPTAWTNAATPGSNTIEGQAQGAGGAAAGVPNVDASLLIEYFALSGATPVACGHWSQSSNAFVPAGGYTQAGCVVPGALVRVTMAATPAPVGSAFGGLFAAVRVSGSATMPVLQT